MWSGTEECYTTNSAKNRFKMLILMPFTYWVVYTSFLCHIMMVNGVVPQNLAIYYLKLFNNKETTNTQFLLV